MIYRIISGVYEGIKGKIVEVESDIHFKGSPGIQIVGMAQRSVQESKERVLSAITSSGFSFPRGRIIINIAPANLKKEGSHLDLPITIALLLAGNQITPRIELSEFMFAGELSLSGEIRSVPGILPLAFLAKKKNIKFFIVPHENIKEAAIVKDVGIIGVKHIRDVVSIIEGKEIKISPPTNPYEISDTTTEDGMDFKYVKGQEYVKRAIEIAVAGKHNILMIGSPGSGKSMMASCIPTIMPDMSLNEIIETSLIYSISGKLSENNPLITYRPFRSPHHTASHVAIVGGGTHPTPGEVSLAHNGVLFMDEFPHFTKDTIEALREPLETGFITISRSSGSITFPSRFILVAAMNPCPCGYFNDPLKECTCSIKEIHNYRKKISGPILDRIDIQVEVKRVPPEKLEDMNEGESSKSIKERVERAIKIQEERYKNLPRINRNADLYGNYIREFAPLDNESKTILHEATLHYGFSARTYNKIIKISRTIADIDGEKQIKPHHIAEAIQYRITDSNYWDI